MYILKLILCLTYELIIKHRLCSKHVFRIGIYIDIYIIVYYILTVPIK